MNSMGKTSVLLLLLLFIISPIESQSRIPNKQDGFWYGEEKAVEGSLLIEAFFDPVCPDSRDSWPPLKRILEQYGSRVSLVVHTFPLPYHDNAFATSRALHIVNKVNTSTTYNLLESFFECQEQFLNAATLNMSRASVIDHIVKFVTNELGTSYHSAMKSGFTDHQLDLATRVSFKYGCLRGVYGTPFFFVNGFPLPDAGSAIDYKGWKKIIDPLVDTRWSIIRRAISSLYFF